MTTTAPASLNQVHLVGRVSADPESKLLPSGDTLVTFRLVVARDAAARRMSQQSVDTIECTAWTARLRRSVLRLHAGEHVEVTGALRRRFRRAGPSVQSFVAVEVGSVSRVTVAED